MRERMADILVCRAHAANYGLAGDKREPLVCQLRNLRELI